MLARFSLHRLVSRAGCGVDMLAFGCLLAVLAVGYSLAMLTLAGCLACLLTVLLACWLDRMLACLRADVLARWLERLLGCWPGCRAKAVLYCLYFCIFLLF